MPAFNHQTAITAEKLYKQKPSQKNAAVLIGRYWSLYIGEGDLFALRKAVQLAEDAYLKAPDNVELLFLVVCSHIRLKNFGDAEALLKKIGRHKAFLKTNNPFAYGFLLSCRAEIFHYLGNARQLQKTLKAYENLMKESDDPRLFLVMAQLFMLRGEMEKSTYCYFQCIRLGHKSRWLYLSIYEFLTKANASGEGISKLLHFLIPWALFHDFNLNRIIANYQQDIEKSFQDDPWNQIHILAFYKQYQLDFLLKDLCRYYMDKKDYTPQAYAIYKSARNRQIVLNDLDFHIANAACHNEDEDIPLSTVETALFHSDLTDFCRCYLYHLMISNHNYRYLLNDKTEEIQVFGQRMLRSKQRGRCYYTLYQWLYKVTGDESFLVFLFKDLFTYELVAESDKVKYAGVYEYEKSKVVTYALEDRKAYCVAAWPGFTCFSLGGRHSKLYLNQPFTIRKMVHADINFLELCYRKKLKDFNLLIALSRHYKDKEVLTGEQVEIMQETLATGGLSEPFQYEISACLGRYFAQKGHYDKAIGYYSIINEKYLVKEDFDLALKVLLFAKKNIRALDWVLRRHYQLSSKTLFYAVKQLIKDQSNEKTLAPLCYRLLSKSWYDKDLLRIVLAYYEASLSEWVFLRKILDTVSTPTEHVDKKVLEKGVFMRLLDENFEVSFQSLFRQNPNSPVLDDALHYIIYELIANEKKLHVQTLAVLERIYQYQSGNNLLLYGLFHAYLLDESYNSTDRINNLRRSCQYMEKENILFPIVLKDKKMNWPYMEKNMPFLYHCERDRKVSLFYKFDRDFNYQVKEMDYFQFGLYLAVVPVFFYEKIEYYFLVEGGNRSDVQEITVSHMGLKGEVNELYTYINNALIHESLLQYEEMESVISCKLKTCEGGKGEIL